MAGESITLETFMSERHALASEVVSNWTAWDNARTPWKNLIKESNRYLYATDTTTTSNAGNWKHSTHIPKLTQIMDNLKANYLDAVYPHHRFFNIEGETVGDVAQTKRQKIKAYLVTKHRRAKLRKILGELLDDWIRTGNCFAQVVYVRESHLNPKTGQISPGYVGPKVRRIDPNDIVMNAVARDFESTPKVIRSVWTLGGLMREVEENPQAGYLSEAVELMLKHRSNLSGMSTEQIDKHIALTVDGFGSYGTYMQRGEVEVMELYGDIYDMESGTLLKNHVVTVVDRSFVIRKQPLDNQEGRPRIYHAGWRNRPNNLWAMGPLDNLVGMQYKLDHLENARADIFDKFLHPDRVMAGDVDVEVGEDGSTNYYADEGGGVTHLLPEASVLQADSQMAQTLQIMDLMAGSPQEAAGFRTPGEKTRFEVQTLTAASARVFQNKLSDFEDFVSDILTAELKCANDNIGEAESVRYDEDPLGMKVFMNVSAEDLNITGTIVAEGARHFILKNQQAQELRDFLTQVLPADPELRNHFPTTKLAHMWEVLLDLEQFGAVEEFGRIGEQKKAQALINAAQAQVEEEATIVPGEEFLDEE